MSTAGAGDTLTGILAGSVLAGRTQKNGKENASYEFFEKICMGVYLHGRAGDEAADRFGNAGMKAMDIADAVANVLKEN
jgi:NAD(P)H-hydrate repair Nnr-like enzyme with NAD(P)H-hydrate dehydratase domain